MADDADSVPEIRIAPIVPAESVLVATAKGMRPNQSGRSRRAEALRSTDLPEPTSTGERPPGRGANCKQGQGDKPQPAQYTATPVQSDR